LGGCCDATSTSTSAETYGGKVWIVLLGERQHVPNHDILFL